MNVGARPVPGAEVSEQEWQIRCDLAALSGGRELVLAPHAVGVHTAEQFRAQENDEHYAVVWDAVLRDAVLRLIELGRPDYRS